MVVTFSGLQTIFQAKRRLFSRPPAFYQLVADSTWPRRLFLGKLTFSRPTRWRPYPARSDAFKANGSYLILDADFSWTTVWSTFSSSAYSVSAQTFLCSTFTGPMTTFSSPLLSRVNGDFFRLDDNFFRANGYFSSSPTFSYRFLLDRRVNGPS